MKSTFKWQKLSALINRKPIFQNRDEVALDYRQVVPSQTDSTITNWDEPHLVATPEPSTESGYLVLFMAGSFGNPHRQLSLLQAMVDQGHYAINLRYPNDWTVGGLCRNNPSPDCHESLRRQILSGHPPTSLLDLPAQDCILNRFSKLLTWLAQDDEKSNWGQFIDRSSAPRWSRVIVAGHSQGGGHALLISKEVLVARCVLLSAPADVHGPYQAIAPWIGNKGATPPEACYGFCHTEDRIFERVSKSWDAMGLQAFGDLTCVEEVAPPYAGSHRLMSRMRVSGGRYHGSVATDRATPRQPDGQPVFLDAWHYLFNLPKDQP